MKKVCAILVILKLYLVNFLDFIWTLDLKFLKLFGLLSDLD